MDQAETFLPIEGFPGYSVSNQGRVLNSRSGRFRKQTLANTGYLMVSFFNHGRPKSCTVHRLVAKAFLGPRDGMQVNHVNGVRTDNRLENLEWVTGSQNMKHAIAMGLARTPSENEQRLLMGHQPAAPTRRDKYRLREVAA